MPRKPNTTEKLDTAKRLLIECYVYYRDADPQDVILDDLTDAITSCTWAMLSTLYPDSQARRAADRLERPHKHAAPQAARDTVKLSPPPSSKLA